MKIRFSKKIILGEGVVYCNGKCYWYQ